MCSKPKGRQFHFVNKTQGSIHLSKSLPQEQSAIQSFVQTGVTRSRRIKHAKKVSIESSAVAGQTSDTPDGSYQPDNTQLEDQNNHHSQIGNTSHNALMLLPSLVCHGVSCSQDPFDTASISIDKSVTGLLNYYVYYYHPSQWPNEMSLLRHGVYIYQDSVSSIMKNAVADNLTMSCILGAAACRLQFVDRLPCTLVKGTESRHLQNAFKLLTQAIASVDWQDTDQLSQLLTCMMLLGAAEAYRGHISAAESYLDATRSLLQPRGGLAVIKDECLRGQLAMSDLALACFVLRPCYFDCCYDPGPASVLELSAHELFESPDICTACALLNRPTSFVTLELKILIREVLESYTVKTRAAISSMPTRRAMQITHWLTMRNMAIRNKLLAIKTADQRTHALRVTLIMWTLLSMSITGRAKTSKVMAPKLKNILSQIAPAGWQQDDDVKLWINTVSVHCASVDSIESVWFLGNCVSLSSRYILPDGATSSVSDLEDRLEGFQRDFFFDITVQRSRNRALAEKLYNARISTNPL